MGHLRQLANTIVQQAEIGPNEHRIKQLIQVCYGVTLNAVSFQCICLFSMLNVDSPMYPGFNDWLHTKF